MEGYVNEDSFNSCLKPQTTDLYSSHRRPLFMQWPSVLQPSVDDELIEWPLVLAPSCQGDKWIEWPDRLTFQTNENATSTNEAMARKKLRNKQKLWSYHQSTGNTTIRPELEILKTPSEAVQSTGQNSPPRLHPAYLNLLKAHQIDGVNFMWRQVIERRTGCILAHSMGLGKTLQIITFLSTVRQEADNCNPKIPAIMKESRSILILAPLITLSNWVNEFHKWVPQELQSTIGNVYNFCEESVTASVRTANRIMFLQQWFNGGGVMLMSYDQFRLLLTSTGNQVEHAQLRSCLLNPGPCIVVADEGHRIKNSQAQITSLVKSIRTPARICLTGYPLQNNLREYYCMLEFVSTDFLGNQSEKDDMKKSIENLFADSCMSTKTIAMDAQKKLQMLTRDVIDRRDISVLKRDLPPKIEYFISCKLTTVQWDAYAKFLRELGNKDLESLLVTVVFLRAICNHPAIFQKMALFRREQFRRKSVLSDYESAGTQDGDLDDTKSVEITDQNEFAAIQQWKLAPPLSWTSEFFESVKDIDIWHHSNKALLIMHIAKLCRKVDDKLIIVSHSIACLDYLEKLLLTLGYHTSRIDGQTPRSDRESIIDDFNNEHNRHIMLLSARAGAIGINITSANRIILCDTDWNPCHDEQSIGRIYRYGQRKRVYVYRLFTYSTVETSLMVQSLQKRALASRVIDSRVIPLQHKESMNKYYHIPEKNPKSRLHEISFAITDAVMKSVIDKHRDLIIEISLGEDLVHENVAVNETDRTSL